MYTVYIYIYSSCYTRRPGIRIRDEDMRESVFRAFGLFSLESKVK